jgi:hypothetical protein
MYFRSNLLQQNHIVHGFFGRKGGVSTGIFNSLNCSPADGDSKANVTANKEIICRKLGLKLNQLNMVKQIHSPKVYICNGETGHIEADALVTDKPDVALAVQTADCTPILLADYKHKVIGAVHAGWRGAFAGVIENTINEMIKLGAHANSIIAAIGPTIQQDTYEVDAEFKANFIKQCKENESFFKEHLKLKDKFFFDLPAYCTHHLKESGIVHIDDLKINTYIRPDDFFSCRRSKHEGSDKFGAQISIIALRA